MQPLSMPVLRSAAAALALGTFAWAVPAVAQDTEAPVAVSALKIDQVTVTARKREEAAQNVPVPITALTTQLRSATIRDLRDLNGFAPNVNISQEVGRASAASITIRGISPVRSDDNSFDAPVAVAIDGIFLGTLAGTVLENFDLERIEVLRGPQGTLFGKNTVGGVVNVVRSRPTGEWGAKLKYTTGSWDQQEFRGVLNAPLIEDKLAVKAFFTNLQRDGYIRNDFLEINQPQQDYQNYGLTFLFTPNDWFEAILTVEKFEDSSQIGGYLNNGNLAPGVVPAPPAGDISPNLSGGLLSCLFAFVPCRTTPLGTIPKTINPDLANPGKIDTEAVTLRMKADINENLTLVSVTGYRKTSEDRIYDFDGTSANFITIDRENDIEQFSEELRLEGSWETDNLGTIDIVAGVYYSRTEFDQDWRTGGVFWDFVGILVGYSLSQNTWGNPDLQAAAEAIHGAGVSPVGACLARSPLGTLDPIFGTVFCEAGLPDEGFGTGFVQRLFEEQTTESIAFFSQIDWELFEGFTATAGFRWTEETKDFRAGQAYLTPLARDREFGFPGFADLSNKWTEVTPTFGLSYQFTDDLLVYASYSKGFHSGGFFGVNQNVRDFERDQYDPEFAKNWELGMKSQWFDNRVQVNISLFRNDFKDKQEASVQVDPSSNTVATVFSNVADAVYQGAEFELQAVLTENVSIFGSVGYLDAKYTDFMTDIDPTDDCVGLPECIVDATGLTPRNAPEWTFGVGATFTMLVGNGGELELYTKYDWVDKVEGDLLNASFVSTKPRENLVASLTYRWEQYSVTVFGRNLTNDRFETIALINPLFAAGTINPGASWGVEVEAEF